MDIVLSFLYLIAGFYMLIKGANFVIDNASALALKIGIPLFIVGLTVVAFGTSLPELSVSLFSSIKAFQEGIPADIAVGNIIGSNMANLTLIFGSAALFAPVVIHKRILKQDVPFLLGISILFVLFMYFFDEVYRINRIEALVLILCFVMYMTIMIKQKVLEDVAVDSNVIVWKALLLLFIGFIGVIIGGNLVTLSAERLSISLLVDVFNMNPLKVTSLVGLSVVAVGTSLPELVTTIIAVKKGSVDIAVGNVVGSNIFNILLVGGLSGLIVPLTLQKDFLVDAIIVVVITLVLFIMMRMQIKIYKFVGYFLLMSYVVYLVYIITRSI
jgi:cation:H+ antiporter